MNVVRVLGGAPLSRRRRARTGCVNGPTKKFHLEVNDLVTLETSSGEISLAARKLKASAAIAPRCPAS
jgi:hypothetical protein